MKNVAKLMAIRLGVYALLVTYLGLDLFVWRGPVYKSLNESPRDEATAIAEAKAEGVVARVYYRPIYKAQVEEKMKEYLWRRGRSVAETLPGERKALRLLIVNQLIDDELVKLQIKVSMSEEVAVPKETVAEALAVEMARYPDERVFEELADRAGWKGKEEREMRLAARIQRAEHIERMVDVSVDDDEVRAWFEDNRDAVEGDFESNRAAIRDALLIGKKDEAWSKFRIEKLRRYANGKIDLFRDVLYADSE